MNRKKALFGLVGVLVLAVVSTAYTANLQVGDDDLKVNDSPVLTVATSGGLTGEIVSASAVMASTQTGVTVYTTPATGEFVLTQICVSYSGSLTGYYGLLQGSTVGPLASGAAGSTSGKCTEYFPGLSIPPNEALTMNDDATINGPTVATIIGVYSAPAP